MKYRHRSAVRALWSLAGMLFAISAFAADPDTTGLVPTVWYDFDTQPDASKLGGTNKGSVGGITFSSGGTKTYKTGARSGWALDSSKFTPWSNDDSYLATYDGAYTILVVMNLGSNANGITLNVRNMTSKKDIIIRRGSDPGSLVVGYGPQSAASECLLTTTVAGWDTDYHLLSVVVEAARTGIYVDGALATNDTAFGTWLEKGAPKKMQFGSRLESLQPGEVAGGGCIDDLRIHAAVLTPAQMRAVAAEYRLVPMTDALEIAGAPQNWGNVSPAYGVVNGLSQNDTVSCYAVGSETESTKIVPIGYSLYSIATDNTESLVEESSATSFTYMHGTCGGHLVWNWAQSNLVTVAASEGGTVSVGDWVGYGGSFAVTATPFSGYKFSRWTGDTAGIDVRSASVVLSPVTEPRALSAVFINENIDESVQWVSPDGNDENDGYSESAPRKTISAAVAWLNLIAQSKSCTVHVAPGLYKISSPIVVTNAIHIIGADADPSRTIVSNTVGANWTSGNHRVFRINHADALIANLLMQKGSVWGDWTEGGNFYIESAGGTVSNCVVEAGEQKTNHAGGAGGTLEAGLVTHTVFRKNIAPDSSPYCSGGGNRAAVLHLRGQSRAENCLLADNPQSTAVVLVRLGDSALMRNCTIVDSGIAKTNGNCKVFSSIWINSAKASVINTVIAGVTNKIDGAACPPTGNVENFLTSAYDGDVTGLPTGTITGTAATFFKKYEEGDYRPKTGGVLVNKGQSYEPLPAKDLGGNKRLIGSKIDIGCYEAPAAEFRIHLR